MSSSPPSKKMTLLSRARSTLLAPVLNPLLERALWSSSFDRDPTVLIRIQRLLAWGADPQAPLQGGWIPLGIAAPCGQRLAELLLEAGADVNAESLSGETPLTAALEFKNVTLCERLLCAGADPEKPNRKGQSPMEIAGERRPVFTTVPLSSAQVAAEEQQEEALRALLSRAILNKSTGLGNSAARPRAPRL